MLGLPPFPKRCNYINHMNHNPSNGPPRIKMQGRWNCAQERIQTSKCSNLSSWWPAYGSNSKNTKCNWFISSLSFYLQEIDEDHQQKNILLSIPLFVGEKTSIYIYRWKKKLTCLKPPAATVTATACAFRSRLELVSGGGASCQPGAVAEMSILSHLEIGMLLEKSRKWITKNRTDYVYIYTIYIVRMSSVEIFIISEWFISSVVEQ